MSVRLLVSLGLEFTLSGVWNAGRGTVTNRVQSFARSVPRLIRTGVLYLSTSLYFPGWHLKLLTFPGNARGSDNSPSGSFSLTDQHSY